MTESEAHFEAMFNEACAIANELNETNRGRCDLLVAIVWPAVVLFVLPRLPAWLQGTAYAAVFGYACYTWGRLAEHKRRIQDALRYGEELSRFHEMMTAAFDHLREGLADVDVAFAKLEKAAKPKASELN